jgi:hypothetical protein
MKGAVTSEDLYERLPIALEGYELRRNNLISVTTEW